MKIGNHFLLVLTIAFWVCFNGQVHAQKPEHLFIIEEGGGANTRTTISIPDLSFTGTVDSYRRNPQKAKTPIILVAKLPYHPLFDTTIPTRIAAGSRVKLPSSVPNYIGNQISFFTKNYASYIIPDTSSASLLVLGITPDNIGDYRYRVVVNDSNEIIPWSPIPALEKNYGAKKPYGLIGNFKYPDQFIMVEVINRKNYSIRDGVIFHWVPNSKPVIKKIALSISNGKATQLHPVTEFATKFDKTIGLPLDFKFPKHLPVDISIYLSCKINQTFDYTCYIKDKDTIRKANGVIIRKDNELAFSDISFDVPGKYELIICRSVGYSYMDKNVIKIPYEVYTSKEQKMKELRGRILIWTILILFISIIALLIYYLNNRRKLKKANQQKEKATLHLKAIRSQLNPHFTFNALNSIQNLMNKSDVEAANHYLAKFSSLTRRVLTTGDHDLISLADEITLLDDYLQMEQLRFGFEYTIKADESLNKANIEIPAMLLQPFVENAVKHGIALLHEKGQIEIGFTQHVNSLVLSVSDNGNGFQDTEHEPENPGLGLKLSKERIALLNKIYKNQCITMEIAPETTGVKVKITLGDWL